MRRLRGDRIRRPAAAPRRRERDTVFVFPWLNEEQSALTPPHPDTCSALKPRGTVGDFSVACFNTFDYEERRRAGLFETPGAAFMRLSVQTAKTYSCVLAPQNMPLAKLKECMRFALANDIGFEPALNQAEMWHFKRFFTMPEKSRLGQGGEGDFFRIRFR